MTVSVHITRRAIAFMVFRLAMRMPGNQLLFALVLVFAMKVTLTSDDGFTAAVLASGLTAGVLFGILAIYANSVLVSVASILYASFRRGGLGEHVFVLSKEGLREKTSAMERLYPWDSLSVVLRTPRALYARAGREYHCFPLRAFPGREAFQAFCEDFSALRSAAKAAAA